MIFLNEKLPGKLAWMWLPVYTLLVKVQCAGLTKALLSVNGVKVMPQTNLGGLVKEACLVGFVVSTMIIFVLYISTFGIELGIQA